MDYSIMGDCVQWDPIITGENKRLFYICHWVTQPPHSTEPSLTPYIRKGLDAIPWKTHTTYQLAGCKTDIYAFSAVWTGDHGNGYWTDSEILHYIFSDIITYTTLITSFNILSRLFHKSHLQIIREPRATCHKTSDRSGSDNDVLPDCNKQRLKS